MINLAIVGMASVSQTLYFALFVYFYISLDTPNHFISLMIASTTLVVVFWGPVVARTIDNSPKRLLFAACMAAVCALAILGQLLIGAFAPQSTILYAASLVVLFALAFNPLSVIIDQYVVPNLADGDDLAFSKSEKIETSIGIMVSIFLFAAYNKIEVNNLLTAVVVSYTVLAGLLMLGFRGFQQQDTAVKSNDLDEVKQSPPPNIRKFFYDQRYLILALVCVAIVGSSFSATIDLIGFNLDNFPFRYVFLLGSFQYAVGLASTYYYESHAATDKAGILTATFRALILGCGAMAIIAFTNISNSIAVVVSYFAVVAIFEFGGQLWGLWSITHIRKISPDGAFATTFSYLRVPRALSSFIGLSIVGFFIEWDRLEVFMAFGLLLLFVVHSMRGRLSSR